jgi:hypothetical protein
MATVIILSHEAQNPLTANDHHTMTTVITIYTFINILRKAKNPLTTANDHHPTNIACYIGRSLRNPEPGIECWSNNMEAAAPSK